MGSFSLFSSLVLTVDIDSRSERNAFKTELVGPALLGLTWNYWSLLMTVFGKFEIQSTEAFRLKLTSVTGFRTLICFVQGRMRECVQSKSGRQRSCCLQLSLTFESKVIISFLEWASLYVCFWDDSFQKTWEFCVLDPLTHSSLIHSVYSWISYCHFKTTFLWE